MGYTQVALPSIYIFFNVKEGWYGVTMAEIDGRGGRAAVDAWSLG